MSTYLYLIHRHFTIVIIIDNIDTFISNKKMINKVIKKNFFFKLKTLFLNLFYLNYL